jgi:hypothetical protein
MHCVRPERSGQSRCDGDTITNIVNGVVVKKATKASGTRGKIIRKSEGAEVFFRNITLTLLNK